MQKIFQKTDVLDKRACKKFFLNEELLMENAASSLSNFIKDRVQKGGSVLFLCGGGNNGADGYAAARMLSGLYEVFILQLYPPSTKLAKVQYKRAKSSKIKFLQTAPKEFDVYVDCILGSGQKGDLDTKSEQIVLRVNSKNGIKIACDIPTGIYSKITFKADFTLTMGALKSPLFEDFAKDFVGEIIVCNLGVDRSKFESETDMFLLDRLDLNLPIRNRKNSNKGDFGHLVVIGGEHRGASILSALAALNFGVGLVSLLTDGNLDISSTPSLMQSSKMPPKASSLAIGMGLGNTKIDISWFEKMPFVMDADLFYDSRILDIKNTNRVFTPHPKEFTSLLKLFGFGDFGVEYVQTNRFMLARKFSLAIKGVLVLKGANTIIAQDGVLYVCDFGSPSLSKGGSGDVLCGFIGALLAQGFSPFDAAKNGVLAHSLASLRFEANNYSLTPESLIEAVKWL